MKRLNINVYGNKKLVNNDKVRHIIWNLPAEKTCPFSTNNCRKLCYAKKSERMYSNVKNCRENNYIESLSNNFVENMIYTIESELNTKKYIGKLCIFRIHESGDFYSIEYAAKWLDIVRHFENDKRITFLAYTKSILYFVNLGYGLSFFPGNIIIRSSIWDDTRSDLIELTKIYNFPIYTALTDNEMEIEKSNGHIFYNCLCNDCSKCLQCINKSKKDIIVKIH